jgi:branched-subunit amino acid transport protein
MLALIFSTSSLLADAAPEVATSAHFDYKLLITVCGTIGGLISSALSLGRWLKERSFIVQTTEKISYVSKLREFLESDIEIKSAHAAELHASLDRAEADLRRSLLRSRGPQPPSRFRKAILGYAPRGWRAWIAHSLFYTISLAVVGLLVGLFASEPGEIKSSDVLAVIAFCGIVILLQRWASVEYRIQQRIRIPARTMRYWKWYPANNRFALLGQFMLVSGVLSLIAMFIPTDDSARLYSIIPWWQRPFALLVMCAYLPIGYLWTQVEFGLSNNESFSNGIPVLKIFASWPKEPELRIAIIAFTSLLAWNLLLLLDFYRVPSIAGFPEPSGFEQVGVGMIIYGALIQVALIGLLPLIAVYRGTIALSLPREIFATPYHDGDEIGRNSEIETSN